MYQKCSRIQIIESFEYMAKIPKKITKERKNKEKTTAERQKKQERPSILGWLTMSFLFSITFSET